MEIIRERKIFKILLIFGIIFSALIIFNTKAYAASTYLSVKYNGKEVTTDKVLNLSMDHKNNPVIWNISTNNKSGWRVRFLNYNYIQKHNINVIKLSPNYTNNTLGLTPLSLIQHDPETNIKGRIYIEIYLPGTNIKKWYKIQVTPTKKSDLKVNSTNTNPNNPMPLINGFTHIFTSTSANGFRVTSPCNDTIKVYHNGDKITVEARSTYKKQMSAYVDIIEYGERGIDGKKIRLYYLIKPHVTKLIPDSRPNNVNIGQKQWLVVKTYPVDFSKLKGHGTISFKSLDPNYLTVDKSRNSYI